MARESLVGTTIKDYVLQSLVGEGGTSTVYRATHPKHGLVAVKILRAKLRRDTTAVARFLREAEYGTRIVHRSIIHTIEAGEAEPGLHFLVTEWAPGELLDTYVKSRDHLAPKIAADIIVQLADAVHAVHAAGVVHRDLKPENVMYDSETHFVKLLDFGIATETDISQSDRLTRAGFFVGTLMYVAPEALSGEVVTVAADQYSLATIAYLLLTGTHPYRAKPAREMFTQLLSQPPIPISQARKDLVFPVGLERVISRALSRDPRDRFPDILIFSQEFYNAATNSGDASPEGLMARLKGILRRSPEEKPISNTEGFTDKS